MPSLAFNGSIFVHSLFYLSGLGSIAYFFWRRNSSTISSKQISYRTLAYFLMTSLGYWGVTSAFGDEGAFFISMAGGFLIFSLMWTALMKENLSLNALKRERNVKRDKLLLSNALGGEFRTQLNGVVGAANLLQVTALSAEQQQYISMIKSCSDSLQKLINEVLEQTHGSKENEISVRAETEGSSVSKIAQSKKNEVEGVTLQKSADLQAKRPSNDVYKSSPKTRKLEILIADDIEVNLVVMRKYLEKLGYECESAVNGKEVVRMVNKKQYDLLLLDCQMPEMDGFAATAEILKRFPDKTSRPYIVAVTAHGNEGDKQKSREVGMDGFITKPFSIQLLQETLQQVCQIKNVVPNPKWKKSEAA